MKTNSPISSIFVILGTLALSNSLGCATQSNSESEDDAELGTVSAAQDRLGATLPNGVNLGDLRLPHTHSFENFTHSTPVNGVTRYIDKKKNGDIKLYLDNKSVDAQTPDYGYQNSSSNNECGPVAAKNLLQWYGINGSVAALAKEMNTNSWAPWELKALGLQLPGTSTSNLRKTLEAYVSRNIPGHKVTFRYGAPNLEEIMRPLAKGYPVLVNYRTSCQNAHYAVIVGVEMNTRGGDPVVHFANAEEMSWTEFKQRWEMRWSIAGFDTKPLFEKAGEHDYQLMYIEKTTDSLWDGTHRYTTSFAYTTEQKLKEQVEAARRTCAAQFQDANSSFDYLYETIESNVRRSGSKVDVTVDCKFAGKYANAFLAVTKSKEPARTATWPVNQLAACDPALWEETPIWRLQVRMNTGSVADACTYDNIFVQFNDATPYRFYLDKGWNDFDGDTGEIDTMYDIVPSKVGVKQLKDIKLLRFGNGGTDGLCVKDIELRINGDRNPIYYKDFGAKTCQWVDENSGHSPTHTISGSVLRNGGRWKLSNHLNVYWPPSVLPVSDVADIIEGAVGDSLHNEPRMKHVSWDRKGSHAVEFNKRRNDSTISIDLDFKYDVDWAPNPHVDVDFDLSLACKGKKLTLEAKNFKADVEYSLLPGLDQILESIGSSFVPGIDDMTFADQGVDYCPTAYFDEYGNLHLEIN